MKAQSKFTKVVILVYISILLLCLLTFILAPQPSRTYPENTPDYVTVWPPPDSTIWTAYYYLPFLTLSPPSWIKTWPGVNVTIRMFYFDPAELLLEDAASTDDTVAPFEDRVYLYIDGVQLSNSQGGVTFTKGGIFLGDHVLNLYGIYEFNWLPVLYPGCHTAKIKIDMVSGTIIEYEWQFIIR